MTANWRNSHAYCDFSYHCRNEHYGIGHCGAVVACKIYPSKTGVSPKGIVFALDCHRLPLACPISISTDFSPLNLATAFQQDAAVQQAPAAPPLLPEAMPGVSPGPAAAAKADLWQIGAYLWAAGVWGMLLFGAVSYLLLKRRLRFAVKRSSRRLYGGRHSHLLCFRHLEA